jgi:hypothetical protein
MGFYTGVVPEGDYIPHPKYPWYRRWRLNIRKNVSDIF